jgi:hypothetical protein
MLKCITAYLKNGGRLEVAQQMAAHGEVSLEAVERIGI